MSLETEKTQVLNIHQEAPYDSTQVNIQPSDKDNGNDDQLTANDTEESLTEEIVDATIDRNALFEKAEVLFAKGKLDMALSSYLQCIKGIEKGSGFTYLPQCLHKIAEVYHRRDEDAKAIEFLKAEKLYYETALIDSKHMQNKIETLAAESDTDTDPSAADPVTLRAAEYEHLSKLCLQNNQRELALEFCGKATKLYQQEYGDDHPTTQRALDLLTSVYAEVGREEYEAKLSQYEADKQETGGAGDIDEEEASKEPGTRLRKRLNKAAQHIAGSQEQETATTNTSEDSDEVTPQQTGNSSQQPLSSCSLIFLWILLVVCGILAIFLFGVVYCRLTRSSWTCHYMKIQKKKIWEFVSYMWYKWNHPAGHTSHP